MRLLQIILLGFICSFSLQAQEAVQAGHALKGGLLSISSQSIDTLRPVLLGDSCSDLSTYYFLNGKVITGAALVGNGVGIESVGQLFTATTDSLSIGSILVEILHVDRDSNQGSFSVSIYAKDDLNNSLGTSLPRLASTLTDTNDASIINEFFFNNPVNLKGDFWAVINTYDQGDSLFLTSTSDDCGGRTAAYQVNGIWNYYQDQYQAKPNDPLDLALKMGAVVNRIVGETALPLVFQDVSLYPNPAKDQVNFKVPPLKEELTLEVFNAAGIKVLSRQIQTGDNRLNLEHLPQGIYQCKLSAGAFVTIKALSLNP